MLIACWFFSCVDVSAKWLAVAGLPILQITFMRYVGHFIVSLLIVLRGGFNLRIFKAPKLFLVILRSFCLLGSTTFNFIALKHISLTLTSTIMFSAPIIVCALSGPLLGEKVGRWRWSAIIVGFTGVLIAMRPFDDSFHWAMLSSLTAASCFSLYSILTRKLSGDVEIDLLQLYSGAAGTLVLFPFVLTQWQNPSVSTDWIPMVLIGGFGWLGHELMTRAHKFSDASALTPFNYVFILYMIFWSFAVFDTLPDVWTVCAGAIIVASGLIIWVRERRYSQTIKT